VNAGEVLQIAGANGSGKTSLLKALCGLIYPDAGAVLWRGADIRSCLDDYLAELSYVGHSNGIKLGLTCIENLKFAGALMPACRHEDVPDVLAAYGLGAYEDTPAHLLSSGQRRRLALARLSIGQARIWVLDEPFTSLDESGRRAMQEKFHTHLDDGGVIVMTSHEEYAWENATVVTVNL
jgi:heme exporter protein A